MKSGGGKRKGGDYEREICKKLSLWISEGQREDIFWRSAMSGGRATVQYKKGVNNKSQVCDISAIDPLGNFLIDKTIIECKTYRCLHIDSFIFNYSLKTNNAYNFWIELSNKAKEVNKIPILICKQNNSKSLIILPHYLASKFSLNSLAIIKKHDISIEIFLLDNFLGINFSLFKNAISNEN